MHKSAEDVLASESAVLSDLEQRYLEYWRHTVAEETRNPTPFRIEPVSVERLRNLPPQHVSRIARTREDPWHGALRAEVREVGWRLYAFGGVEAMHQVEKVIELGRFGSFVDHAWNLIGFHGDKRGWWVC